MSRIIPIYPDVQSSTAPMSLIIKVTELCNFKCTFCSSTNISKDHYQTLDINLVFDFLKRYPNTSTIIVNGGDPLMISPQYYWDLLEFIELHELSTTLSFTTNLWPFYKNPGKWKQLFKHDKVGVTTSFHYGDTRRITKNTVYTEKDFWKVSNLFLQEIGYRPDFISVITEDNESNAIDNVILAKNMGVECKLNYAMASGDQGKPYILSKIYNTYLQIISKELHHWEYNSKQLLQRLKPNANTTCPQSINCDSNIRALNPGGDYYSCGSFADDMKYSIPYQDEIYKNNIHTPLSNTAELISMKNDCLTCNLYKICNGCKKTISDLKAHNMVQQHCKQMKQLQPQILSLT